MTEFRREEVVLPLLVAERAAQAGEQLYLQDVTGGEATYRQLHERALRWARALMLLGVEPGERVVTMVHNTVENYALWLGIAWAGAIEVPINVAMQGSVLAHQLRLPGARVVVADEAAVPAIAAVADQVPELETVLGQQAAPTSIGRLAGQASAELLAAAGDGPSRPYAELQPWHIASVIYTSGTTGPAKGVLMPWGQLHAGQLLTVAGIQAGPSPNKVIYVSGPPNHVQAKGAAAAMAMLGGVAVMRHAFSGRVFWDEVRRFGATDTGLVGAMAQFLLAIPPAPDDAETPLTNVLMAPVVPAVDEFNARFGTQVWSAYNMTEISVPTWLPRWQAGDPPNCGTVRPGYPHYQLRIVDEHDFEVEPGQVGELILRTEAPWTLNAGYLNMPEATVAAWRNGWFHTGDAFRCDERGRYFFVDRLKDTIRRRGENVSSYEVEAEAILHPGVRECAAVAVPADEVEDEIKLVLVGDPAAAVSPEQLWQFLDQRLPRFMVPRYLQFVAELPKTPTLRVQKALIARTVAAADGVHDRLATGPARHA